MTTPLIGLCSLGVALMQGPEPPAALVSFLREGIALT